MSTSEVTKRDCFWPELYQWLTRPSLVVGLLGSLDLLGESWRREGQRWLLKRVVDEGGVEDFLSHREAGGKGGLLLREIAEAAVSLSSDDPNILEENNQILAGVVMAEEGLGQDAGPAQYPIEVAQPARGKGRLWGEAATSMWIHPAWSLAVSLLGSGDDKVRKIEATIEGLGELSEEQRQVRKAELICDLLIAQTYQGVEDPATKMYEMNDLLDVLSEKINRDGERDLFLEGMLRYMEFVVKAPQLGGLLNIPQGRDFFLRQSIWEGIIEKGINLTSDRETQDRLREKSVALALQEILVGGESPDEKWGTAIKAQARELGDETPLLDAKLTELVLGLAADSKEQWQDRYANWLVEFVVNYGIDNLYLKISKLLKESKDPAKYNLLRIMAKVALMENGRREIRGDAGLADQVVNMARANYAEVMGKGNRDDIRRLFQDFNEAGRGRLPIRLMSRLIRQALMERNSEGNVHIGEVREMAFEALVNVAIREVMVGARESDLSEVTRTRGSSMRTLGWDLGAIAKNPEISVFESFIGELKKRGLPAKIVARFERYKEKTPPIRIG